MKRTTAGLFAVLCAVFVSQSVSVLASESFTLDIPTRGNPQQETGEVRITLMLTANTAGSQLVVSGNVTLDLGQTKQTGGDSVTFETAGGNDVRITYRPKSNFGADFCSGTFAVEKQIPMRFVGAQD